MKILIIQSARLGDIFLTRPILRALRRIHPEARIDLLVRESFAPAAFDLSCIDRLWPLPVAALVEPLLADTPNYDASLQSIGNFLSHLEHVQFDQVINLGFSNLSSHLTAYFEAKGSKVAGYSRFIDGTLALPDDPSAYFHAQVGVGRANRFHLADLFAAVAGVTLTPEDWAEPVLPDLGFPKPYAVLHLGASEPHKRYPASLWGAAVRSLKSEWAGNILIVGTGMDNDLLSEFLETAGGDRVVSGLGQTSIRELFRLIQSAEVFIGADSGPLHVASLTGVPAVNISCRWVNFWETGPKTPRSRVLYADEPSLINPEDVASEILSVLKRGEPVRAHAITDSFDGGFRLLHSDTDSVPWEVNRSIYITKDFSAEVPRLFVEGIQRVFEANALALEQIEKLKTDPHDSLSLEILDRACELIASVSQLIPETAPVVNWFVTQKIRIAPGPLTKVVLETERVHQELSALTGLYWGGETHGSTRDQVDKD